MKFVLKVLVLVCLVVMSKLAKEESLELETPMAGKTEATPVFTNNIRETPISQTRTSNLSVRFVKGTLQIN
jgi:hypothetical protein